MKQHPIFEIFQPVSSIGTGAHMHDFLGGKTRVAFKNGWAKHAKPEGQKVTVGLPPHNEHYFDWIATLNAVKNASGTFRMAELGAGWAPWLVHAALACKQNTAITRTELLAVEADATHFEWISDHFRDNGIAPEEHTLVHGAVSETSEILKFPVIEDPTLDYGASLQKAQGNIPTVDVQGYTVAELLGHFSGPIDFLHVDIQGAEYDVIPSSLNLISRSVKTMMIGTHQSDTKHDQLVQQLHDAGWKEKMNFPRKTVSNTGFGDVQFDDGFLYFTNANF